MKLHACKAGADKHVARNIHSHVHSCAPIIYGLESRSSCVGRRAGFCGSDNRDNTQDEEGCGSA